MQTAQQVAGLALMTDHEVVLTSEQANLLHESVDSLRLLYNSLVNFSELVASRRQQSPPTLNPEGCDPGGVDAEMAQDPLDDPNLSDFPNVGEGQTPNSSPVAFKPEAESHEYVDEAQQDGLPPGKFRRAGEVGEMMAIAEVRDEAQAEPPRKDPEAAAVHLAEVARVQTNVAEAISFPKQSVGQQAEPLTSCG